MTAMTPLELLNRALFLAINAGPGTASWLIQFASLIANDLIGVIPLALAALWLWGDDRLRALALRACAVALLAVAANQAIGMVWPHPRPFMIGLGTTWFAHTPDSSFPSDHVTVFSGIGFTLIRGRVYRLSAVVCCGGLLVAWARVFLGVHFPFDMAGAVVVAVLTYAVLTPLWKRAGVSATTLVLRLYRWVFARPIATGWIRP